MRRYFFLILYYTICRYLAPSYFPILGKISKRLRYICCKNIFAYCGENVNIERLAFFGSGKNVSIGNQSGIGINCTVPNNIIMGNNVMMGPNVYFFSSQHCYERTDIPMIEQGTKRYKAIVIEDDVWIGRSVMIMPGLKIAEGTIIAAGCVLTKSFPARTIVGGVPGTIIRNR